MSTFIPNIPDAGIGFLENIALRRDSTSIHPCPSAMYVWNHTHLSPLAMAQVPPPCDFPSIDWNNRVAARLLDQISNTLEIDVSLKQQADVQRKIAALRSALSGGNAGLSLIRDVVSEIARHGRIRDPQSDRPKTLEDYAALFRVIGLPPVAAEYSKDSVFASMRVAGPNPVMIRRLRTILPNVPLTEKQYQFVIPGDSLEAALKTGRLYVCDYRILEKLAVNPAAQPAKYLYAPVALFAEHPTTGALTPVAIQTAQQPDNDRNNLFIADGSYNWLIAKTIVETADATVHEPVSHLGRTHLFIEPFVVATGRNLPPDHPVCRLLWPHFEGTLFINHAAVFTLAAPGGNLEQLLAATLPAALGMAVDQLHAYPFNDAMLPKTFLERDVADLQSYPYRDDAMLYWNAIGKWVRNYLALFYGSDEAVAADIPLQRWYSDLIANEGGRVIGLGEEGGIKTRRYLTDALTMVIFTSSVQHAAVNFPQYDLMSYCPNMPLAAYSQFPGSEPAGPRDYLDILPTLTRAGDQQKVGFMLGTMHYTQLSQYPPNYFSGVGFPLLQQFQSDVAAAGHTIRTRNTTRTPYKTLLPDAIPQSINI
jgi:arachidonate 15-lipoxygenase